MSPSKTIATNEYPILRGRKAQIALQFHQNPYATPAEVAKAIGMTLSNLYVYIGHMKKEGILRTPVIVRASFIETKKSGTPTLVQTQSLK